MLEGRGGYKERLTLLLALDHGHPDSRRIPLWKSTFFYAENLREIPCVDIDDYVGTLSKAETERVIRELNAL